MFDAELMVSNHNANSLGKARTILLLGPRLILLALAITMIFIVVISINLENQKTYSGKTVNEWVDYPGLEGDIKSYLISEHVLSNAFRESISNGSFRLKVGSSNIEKSASSLRESGLEPIEELVAILNRKEVHLIDVYYKIARRLPNSIKRKLPRPLSQQSRRQNALLILGDLGEIAIPALPALRKISVDKSETQQFRKTDQWVISRIEVFEKKKSLP